MLRALSVASEVFPLVKTGGLADVVGALPAALAPQNVELRTLVPGYPDVLDRMERPETVWADNDYFGGPARILAGDAAGIPLFTIDAPHLYGRPGNPYTGPDGQDWPDNPQRFAALAYAGALIGQGAVAGFVPELVHAHDWQAGLTPAYLALGGQTRSRKTAPGTIMTVHNLAFQGQVPASLLASLRLPASSYTPEGVEYYGSIGMLKAGLRYAGRITTVSPSYAQEICTPEGGMGLDGLLRARGSDLSGILNGIDTGIWNPETDERLPATYSAARRTGRRACKEALQRTFGLASRPGALLFGVVSRLSHQKGLDVLLEALPMLRARDAQLVLLGAGDAGLQSAFMAAARAESDAIGVRIGYDEAIAHLIQAGSDAILVPSRFEPCGLTQLCALRYGALPVVSRVGGLADTIIDANEAARTACVATGFQFAPVSVQALGFAIGRVAEMWRRPREWAAMQGRAMRSPVGWSEPAACYAALYRGAAGLTPPAAAAGGPAESP